MLIGIYSLMGFSLKIPEYEGGTTLVPTHPGIYDKTYSTLIMYGTGNGCIYGSRLRIYIIKIGNTSRYILLGKIN